VLHGKTSDASIQTNFKNEAHSRSKADSKIDQLDNGASLVTLYGDYGLWIESCGRNQVTLPILESEVEIGGTIINYVLIIR
jgi:hypothetical protein